ncbi:MAG: DUF5612 domain-containing protein [Paludibaculum sp.]
MSGKRNRVVDQGVDRRPGGPPYRMRCAASLDPRGNLVIVDSVQAGVMTLMAVMPVADTAKFTLERLRRRVF